MEKRLLLAFILSFGILYLWFGGSARRPIQSNYPQLVVNKEVTQYLAPTQDFLKPSPPASAPEIKVIEKEHVLDSGKFVVTFSNVGGTIKNILLKEYNASLPATRLMGLEGYENEDFSLEYTDSEKVIYSFNSGDIKISKIYSISPNDYLIKSDIQIINKTEMSKLKNGVEIHGINLDMSILNSKDINYNPRESSLYEYSILLKDNKIERKGGASKFFSKETKNGYGKIEWLGFRDRYFCLLVKPLFETEGYGIKALDEKNLQMSMRGKLESSPGQAVKLSQTIFFGPQSLFLLKGYDSRFENIMAFSGFALIDGIAKAIYFCMHLIHKIIPNWGICILLLGISIYLLTYPLTLTMMSSMKKMQAIQPKMAALKEKNKNNPQKLNKEIVELYKEHKVNPLGGCLPLVLQMPIFIGLYQVLWRSVSFKGAHFLWIKDLSMPDRLFILPFTIPGLGNEFNLLPLLMVGAVFIQQRLSSKNMVVADPMQASQQKMMGIMMPVFMGAIFYKMASGLTLYFFVFYALSAWTQWKMSKKTITVNVKNG